MRALKLEMNSISIVDVDNEKEQEKLYNRLTKEGYECKILGMM